MEVNGTELTMIRGDSEQITVSARLNDTQQTPVPFTAGDVVYFTVKTSTGTTQKTLQKAISVFDELGKAEIQIDPEDTKELECRVYQYDVQVNWSTGEVTTMIKPSKFTLAPEVTYE